MGSTFRIRAKFLAHVVAPLLFATTLSACSTVPDWVDPTTWIGGDSQASSDQTSDAGGASDQSTAPATDQSTAGSQDAASAQPSGGGKTPDIAAIPPKPTPPSTADEQKQVADSLTADRAQAHYSADALRGDTGAAAPPPSAEPPPAQGATTSEPPAANATASTSTGAGAPSTDSTDSQTAPNSPAPAEAESSPPPPAPNQVASNDSASTSAPAAAPMVSTTGASSAQPSSDMQATFAPSRAPALDPSVSQYVPQPILSHYQETAAAASVPSTSSGTTTARHRHRKKIKTSQSVIRLHYAFKSGTTHMAMIKLRYPRFDASHAWRSAGLNRVPSRSASDPSLFAPAANKTALAVVDFTRETTILDGNARNRIQHAARNFAAQGGIGFVRVVGRATDPASNLPRAIRLRNNFERSEAQATAVARELIRDGIAPQRVVVEAVGDGPAGDRASARTNRSAAIFFES
jgi:hypothetical protein